MPWTDHAGKLSHLKAACLLFCLYPALLLLARWQAGGLGSRPITEAIHFTGDWTVRFLILALAVTPARAVLDWARVLLLRRMLGVTAALYAGSHLILYCLDMKWDPVVVVSEIVLRFYLTIGFVALLGLVVLGVTSTDGWVRRLGKRWKRLHRIVYGIGVLGLFHYMLQVKADVSMPLLGAGIFYWLMLWRILPAGRDRGPVALLGLALASAVLTLVTEWGWYRFGTHIDPMRVLRSELAIDFGLHPVGQVLVFGLLVLLAAQVRRWSQGRAGQSPFFWVALFALGAWADELAVFVFGFDRYDEAESLDWLWQDLAWAALLGALGFVRWLARSSRKRQFIDAIGVACVAYLIVLASNGLRSVEMAFATGLAVLWAVLAWQTWHVSKLAALTLVPLGLLLAYGVAGLM